VPLGRRVAGLVAGSLALGGLVLPWAPPAYAEQAACSEIQQDTTEADDVTEPSVPLQQLRVEEATKVLERRGVRPGEGVGVAVIDSGIADVPGLPQAGGSRNPAFAKGRDYPYYHGTAVAGLIAGADRGGEAGPVGIAPAASLYDVRVYDTPTDSDDGKYRGLTDAGVIDGLEWVAANARSVSPRIRIANVSLAVKDSPELRQVVRRLAALGVVVVAAAGNRPTSADDPVLEDFAGEPRPGEDAAKVVFPAGYPTVVAATSSVPRGVDARNFVLQNSATDIAVPTMDGVSYAVNGVTCLLPPEAATSWAAAETSGILALLMSAFPDESPAETVNRLYRSATGVDDVTTRLTGHGIAQPVEALQRPLSFGQRGRPETSETENTTQQARAPRPEKDVLEDTRHDAMWWGLAGGGALVIALLLRPVLARKRPEDR